MLNVTVLSNTQQASYFVDVDKIKTGVELNTVQFHQDDGQRITSFVTQKLVTESTSDGKVATDVNSEGEDSEVPVRKVFVLDAASFPENEAVVREILRQLPQTYVIVISEPTTENITNATQLQHVLHVNGKLTAADIQDSVSTKINAISQNSTAKNNHQTISEKAFTVMQNIISYRTHNPNTDLYTHAEKYISILNDVIETDEVVLTLNETGNENTNTVIAATDNKIDQLHTQIAIPEEALHAHPNAVINTKEVTDDTMFTKTQTIQTSRVNETEDVTEFTNHFMTPVTTNGGDDRLGYLHLVGKNVLEPHIREITDIIVIVSDIIAQLIHSKQQTEQLNRELGKLEQFRYIISHDLINPLSTAKGYLKEVKDQTEPEDARMDFLETASYALDRVEKMVRSTEGLLAAGKTITEDEKQEINIADVAHDSWKIIDPSHAELVLEDEFTVYGNRQQLNTIFENLFKNAIQHGGRDVTITVGKKQHISTTTRKDPDDKFTIYIEDDGKGINDDVKDSLFQMNVTTKTRGPGNGVGMNIIKTAVEAHGWEIEVDDKYVTGARFEIKNVHPNAE